MSINRKGLAPGALLMAVLLPAGLAYASSASGRNEVAARREIQPVNGGFVIVTAPARCDAHDIPEPIRVGASVRIDAGLGEAARSPGRSVAP